MVERFPEEEGVPSSILGEDTMSGSLRFGGHPIGRKCKMTRNKASGGIREAECGHKRANDPRPTGKGRQ
jgi:hypothetical protein